MENNDSSDLSLDKIAPPHPERAPSAVKERNEIIDRLYHGLPVVPGARANGMLHPAAPVTANEEEAAKFDEEIATLERVSMVAAEETEPSEGTESSSTERKTLSMTYVEMREEVLRRETPGALIGMCLDRHPAKESIKLFLTEMDVTLPVYFISLGDNFIRCFLDKSSKGFRFKEGMKYKMEIRGKPYTAMFMGADFPFPTLSYPLVFFLRDLEETS